MILKILLLLSLFNWNVVGKAEKHLGKYYEYDVILSDGYFAVNDKLYIGNFFVICCIMYYIYLYILIYFEFNSITLNNNNDINNNGNDDDDDFNSRQDLRYFSWYHLALSALFSAILFNCKQIYTKLRYPQRLSIVVCYIDVIKTDNHRFGILIANDDTGIENGIANGDNNVDVNSDDKKEQDQRPNYQNL